MRVGNEDEARFSFEGDRVVRVLLCHQEGDGCEACTDPAPRRRPRAQTLLIRAQQVPRLPVVEPSFLRG